MMGIAVSMPTMEATMSIDFEGVDFLEHFSDFEDPRQDVELFYSEREAPDFADAKVHRHAPLLRLTLRLAQLGRAQTRAGL